MADTAIRKSQPRDPAPWELSSPYERYDAVKQHSSTRAKDDLVEEMIRVAAISAMKNLTATEVSGRQNETLDSWCSNQQCHTREKALFQHILSNPALVAICDIQWQPELSFTVVCDQITKELYEFIAGCIVDYEDETRTSAIFVLVTRQERAGLKQI